MVSLQARAGARELHRTTVTVAERVRERGSAASAVSQATAVSQCSVGIMAYNEEANIGAAVTSVLSQVLATSNIAELLVVASGCEDRSAEVVSDIAMRDPRVRLIEQPEREGKASAI